MGHYERETMITKIGDRLIKKSFFVEPSDYDLLKNDCKLNNKSPSEMIRYLMAQHYSQEQKQKTDDTLESKPVIDMFSNEPSQAVKDLLNYWVVGDTVTQKQKGSILKAISLLNTVDQVHPDVIALSNKPVRN